MSDIETRLTAVEHVAAAATDMARTARREANAARRDATDSRILASGVDDDVAAQAVILRSHTTMLSAIRETQAEHSTAIGELRAGMGHIARLLGSLGATDPEQGPTP